MVLIRVEVSPGQADFAKQKERLKLRDRDVDSRFGLKKVDPRRGVYAMKVTAESAQRASRIPGVSGPFANPRISTAR